LSVVVVAVALEAAKQLPADVLAVVVDLEALHITGASMRPTLAQLRPFPLALVERGLHPFLPTQQTAQSEEMALLLHSAFTEVVTELVVVLEAQRRALLALNVVP
jgi:hypothetical protein